MYKDVLNFIHLLNITFGVYKEYSGGCLKFHYILKERFPSAIGYYNHEHVITQIEDNFYDINGIVLNPKDYLPFEEYGEGYFESAFKEHLK